MGEVEVQWNARLQTSSSLSLPFLWERASTHLGCHSSKDIASRLPALCYSFHSQAALRWLGVQWPAHSHPPGAAASHSSQSESLSGRGSLSGSSSFLRLPIFLCTHPVVKGQASG